MPYLIEDDPRTWYDYAVNQGSEDPVRYFRNDGTELTASGTEEGGSSFKARTDIFGSTPIELEMMKQGITPIWRPIVPGGFYGNGGYLHDFLSDGKNIYIATDAPGMRWVAPNYSGSPGLLNLGPATAENYSRIQNAGVAQRNLEYTGGDWVGDLLGSIGPSLAMAGVGALAMAPAAAASLAESVPAATIAPELNALQASTTGLGSGIGSSSLVDQLVSNLPSVQSMVQKAAINAATQLVTTGEVNPEKILASTLTGALGSTVGSTVAQDVLSATNSSLAASIASGAAQGATVAAITGNDPLQTALASAAASGLGSVAKDSGIAVPQSVINSVVSSVASGAPLDQTLTNAAISVGSGLAKDAISGVMTAYNADQQTAGLQAASDLGNAPTQGFDNNGNPIYRDSSGVWTNDQGVPVDPSTGEPIQAITTATGEYTAPIAVAGTQDTASNATSGLSDAELASYGMQRLPDGSIVRIGETAPDYSGDGTRIEIIGGTSSDTTSEAQTPENSWVSGYDLPFGGTTTGVAGSPVTSTVPVSATSTPAATSGTSGTAAAAKKDSDYSTYIPPIPAYLRDTMLSTGKPSEGSALWQGIDPRLASILTQRAAHGGSIHPRLMKVLQERGGELVPGPENRMYMRHAKRGFAVNGPGTGQSDDIPTMLADGEYVFDADTVAALGDGSSKAGAEALDKMREEIRRHKRSAPVDKIPPKAKSPLEYLKMAKRK